MIDDVAWYKGNSNGKLHDVKTKLPNELGLYDMSGNAREFVLDYYNTFTNKSAIDPIVLTSGSKGHVVRGGDYERDDVTCANLYISANVYSTSHATYYDYNDCSIRLTLNWN